MSHFLKSRIYISLLVLFIHCHNFWQFFRSHVEIGARINEDKLYSSRIYYYPAESPVVVIHVIFILMFRFTDNPTLAGMAAGRHQGHSQ